MLFMSKKQKEKKQINLQYLQSKSYLQTNSHSHNTCIQSTIIVTQQSPSATHIVNTQPESISLVEFIKKLLFFVVSFILYLLLNIAH